MPDAVFADVRLAEIYDDLDRERRAFRGWEEWTPEASRSITDTVSGPVESWVRLTQVALPLVSFRWTFRFLGDGTTLESDSTLRFRSESEIVQSLEASGFELDEVRDAPDRPDREMVFIARRTRDAPL